MDKMTNQELFRKALVEGVSRRIDRELAACDEEVVFSRRHLRAMKRIINGKTPAKPINRKMVAILVAAAVLLLAGCAIIYRDEIRDFITDVKEYFVEIRFDEGDNESRVIEEVYELTYLPDGYVLEKQNVGQRMIQTIYVNSEGEKIKFIQQPLDTSGFAVDIEHDYDKFTNISDFEIYYRHTNGTYYYIWNDGKYAMKLNSSKELPIEVVELIICGLETK